MKLGYAFLADRAEISPGGKLTVTGGDFDTIVAATFPAVSSPVFLAVKLLVDPTEVEADNPPILDVRRGGSEVSAHEFRVDCIEPDGQTPVFSGVAAISLANAHTIEGLPFKMLFTIGLPPLLFRAPGLYKFQMYWDREALGDFPLYVTRVESPAEPAQDTPAEQNEAR